MRAPCALLEDGYTRPVLTAFRKLIASLVALCVVVLTLGRVQVNRTGKSTATEAGRNDTDISAKRNP
jgi:hypothetical protein